MSAISNLVNFVSGSITPTNLNNSLQNLVNWINGVDNGTITLTSPVTSSLTVTGTLTAGGNSIIISNAIYSPTVSAGFGTVSNAFGFYQKIGNMVHTWGSFEAGTVVGTVATLNVPTGSIVYTNRYSTNATAMLGIFTNINSAGPISSSASGLIFADGSTTTGVFISVGGSGTGNTLGKTNANSAANSNSYCLFDYWYAVS